jgi:hypothetical protein
MAREPPRSQALDSGTFLAAIDATTGTDVIDMVREFQRTDSASEPPKDKFETTAAWEKRVAASGINLPYGPGFTAIIKTAEFSYDADLGTADFAGSDLDGSIPDDHLTITPVDMPPPRVLTVRIHPETARLLSPRMAIIYTLEGLKHGVLWGDDVGSDDFYKKPSFEPGRMEEYEGAVRRLVAASFGLKVHVVRLLVFDPAHGGAAHPIVQWTLPGYVPGTYLPAPPALATSGTASSAGAVRPQWHHDSHSAAPPS